MRSGKSWRRAPRLGPLDVPADVRDEVESHLALQIADLIAEGWDPAEAQKEAVRRFGDRRRIERQMLRIDNQREGIMRRTRVLADLGQDVRLALRQLAHGPGHAAVAVGILALGIGASTAAFGGVDGTLLRPLPFPDDDALVNVFDIQTDESGFPASLPEFRDWERDADFFEAIAAVGSNTYAMTGDGEPEQVLGFMVAGDPLGVMGLQPVGGRSFSADELRAGERVVMLGESFWRQRYGSQEDVIGRTIRLNDVPYTVIGVMPRAADLLRGGRALELWLPLEEVEWMERGLHFLSVVGRLREDVTLSGARPRAAALAESLRESGVTLHGLGLADLRTELVGETRALLWLLFGAASFLLLIVCANMANLFLAQSLRRTREFAVRVALGAGRLRLARQVLTESVVIAVLGGIAALGVAYVGSGVLASVSVQVEALAPRSAFDLRIVAFTGAISLLVAVLFGVWPAWRITRSSVAGSLKEAGDARALAGRGSWRRRRLLVAFEVALSLMLLAGAGLLVRSVLNMLDEDKGFDPANVLTFFVSSPPNRYDSDAARVQFFEDLLGRIRALPGVVHVGATNELPLAGGDVSGGWEIVGVPYADNDPRPNAKKRAVSAGYFEAAGIPLLRGRVFTDADREGAPEVVIISESLALRYWPAEDPIGRRVRFLWGTGPDEEQAIVGIVGDVKHDGLDQPVEPMIYRPHAQFPLPGMTIVTKAQGRPIELVPLIRHELAEIDADVPMSAIGTFESVVSESIASGRTFTTILGSLAGIALLVATLGVYAITSQSVSQRTREIGVRMAVGAARRDVLALVIRQELPMIGLGLLAGASGGVAATRLLRAALYGVSATDPVTFAVVAAALLMVALVASWLPARRAARLDPVRALRIE